MSNCTIGLVVPSLEVGGGVPAVARFIFDVAHRNGYKVKLISLSTSSTDASSTRIVAPQTWLRGAVVRYGQWHGHEMVHVGAEWGDLEFQRYKPRKLLTEAFSDCDLLQVISGSPAWANAVAGCGKPLSLSVATLVNAERRQRDANPIKLADWWRKAMTKITNTLDDRGLRVVDAVQLMNPWMLDYSRQINSYRSNVDIRYAPPGVDSVLFCPLPAKPALINPYILCVGRLDDPRKNIGLLLDAFNLLPESLSHIHLITAGSGRPPPSYWEKVQALGLQKRVFHVHRPETTDLVKLYQEATVFTLPSDEEGLGVVILEAMACAVPIVATRCGGPDGIITEGQDGFLVPLNDMTIMSQRIATLCTDSLLNDQVGRSARRTIEARYEKGIAGQAFVEVWEKLMFKNESKR